jgi:hypothetical protein
MMTLRTLWIFNNRLYYIDGGEIPCFPSEQKFDNSPSDKKFNNSCHQSLSSTRPLWRRKSMRFIIGFSITMKKKLFTYQKHDLLKKKGGGSNWHKLFKKWLEINVKFKLQTCLACQDLLTMQFWSKSCNPFWKNVENLMKKGK